MNSEISEQMVTVLNAELQMFDTFGGIDEENLGVRNHPSTAPVEKEVGQLIKVEQ